MELFQGKYIAGSNGIEQQILWAYPKSKILRTYLNRKIKHPSNRMYSSKKNLNKTQYSAFSSDWSTSNSKSIDFGRFRYEREDFNYNDKATEQKNFNQSGRRQQKKMYDMSQTIKSPSLSQNDYRYTSVDQQRPNYMCVSTELPSNRYQTNAYRQFHHSNKKGVISQGSNQFSTFMEMAKKEKDRYIPSYSLMYTPKLPQYLYKSQPFVIQELRQTQDTISQSQQFYQYPPPKAADFHQVRLLGKGKNGEVYLAIHKATGFACAMKIIKKNDINKGTAGERKIMQNQLLRQIKLQLHMSDPNLIELYAVFSDKENIYLIQELGIDGQLYDLMRKNFRFSQQSTALLSRQILKGIEYMHSKHIIHRDIKPENIVIIYGVAKLCDFGWSVYCPLELRSTMCGTPLYLSPEILVGNQYNQKIDIWAFGTLVYELFTGDNPFQIKNRSDLKKIVTDELDFANNFPRRLRAFLQLILKKKSFERPTAAQLQAHQFLKKYAQLETSQELANL